MIMYAARTCLLVMLLGAATEARPDWRSIDGESELKFVATYDGESIPGQFNSFLVLMDFDPANSGAGVLDVQIVTASVDMGAADLDEEVVAPAWFDTVRFPMAHFVADYIIPSQSGFMAQGYLDLKGHRREVRVPFSWTRDGHNVLMEGEFTLDRTDFRIGSGEWLSDETVGFEVQVQFQVVLAPTG